MNKLYRLFLAAFLCFSFAKAELPFEAIQGSGSCIKPEYQQQAAPLYGFVALNTYLKNLRFYGAYGPKNPEVFSPEYKTRPENDCPQDHVASLIQWLFPSFDGHNFVANQLHQDFVRDLPPELIGTVLRTIIEVQLDDPEESVLIFAEAIDRQLNPKAYTTIIAGFKNKPEGEAKQKLIRQSIASRLDSKKCKKIMLFSRILTRALTESQDSDLYPEHTVEQALLAYFWKKSSNDNDQQALLSALGADICALGYASEETPFSKKAYFELATQFKENPEAATQTIFSNPELTAFTGYGWWVYENTYPPLSSFTTATFKGKEYPNCGANTIRNFFNIFCYDATNQTFDINKLAINIQKKKGKLSQKVIDYYQEYPTPSSQHSDQSINDWSDIICNLAGVKYLKTPAGFDHPACEMGSGISNTIHVLTHLITSKKIADIAKSNKKTEEKSAKTFTQMMKLFSNKEKTWEWSVDGKTKIKKDTDLVINFSCNDDSIFDYHFDDGHFFIEYSEKKSRKKWTEKAFEEAETAGSSTPGLLSNFFFYHKPLKWLKKQEHLPAKQQSAALFSGNLYSSEKLPKYIGYILKNKLIIFYPLFNSWVSKLPLEDLQIRHKLYKAFKDHPDAIPPALEKPMQDVQLIEDLCAAIKAKDIAQVKQLLVSYPHTPELLNAPNLAKKTALDTAIKAKSCKSITALHQLGKLELNNLAEDPEHPLIFAVKHGSVKVIQHIIDTWGISRKQIINYRSYDDETILHKCVRSGKAAALEFFIKTYKLKRKFIMKIGYIDDEKETILDIATSNGDLACLKTIIEFTKLSSKDILHKNGDESPLIYAAKSGNYECFEALINIEGVRLTKRRIIKNHSYQNNSLFLNVVETGAVKTIQALANMGNLTSKDIRKSVFDSSAIEIAISKDHVDTTKLLIELGEYTRYEILGILPETKTSSDSSNDTDLFNDDSDASIQSYHGISNLFSGALRNQAFKTAEMLIKHYQFSSHELLPAIIGSISYNEKYLEIIEWCIENIKITKQHIFVQAHYQASIFSQFLSECKVNQLGKFILMFGITKDDFMALDDQNSTYLHYLARHSSPKTISFVLEKYGITCADLENIEQRSMPFYQSVKNNSSQRSFDLFNAVRPFTRVQILETDESGQTVFHRLRTGYCQKTMKQLIKSTQATPEEILQTDDEGKTALECALKLSNWDKPTKTFRSLLKYGKIKRQYLLQTDANGTPLIYKLASKLNEKQLKILVKTCELLPEDLKVQNEKGQILLHYAVETCADYDCLKALLEIGAYTAEDIIQKDNKGQSAWSAALTVNNDCVILLLAERLTAEIILDTDEKGCTSFHRSIQEARGSWNSCIKTLLCIDRITAEHILRTNNAGDNVLHLTAGRGDEFENDLRALITDGRLTREQILLPDRNGQTILEYKDEYGSKPLYIRWIQDYITNYQA